MRSPWIRNLAFLLSVVFLVTTVSGGGVCLAELPEGALLSSAPFVLHIQEAHAHPEAAARIEEILNGLREQSARGKFRPWRVAVEGAVGPVHPEYLRFFKQFPEADEALVRDLQSKGELTGGELFAWDQFKAGPGTGEAIEVVGVEEPALYRENLAAYRELLLERAGIDRALEKPEADLQRLVSRVLNPRLKKFLKQKELGEKQKQIYLARELPRWVSEVLEIRLEERMEQLRFPHLARWIAVNRLEPGLDLKRARADWKRLKRRLNHQNVGKEELENLSTREAWEQIWGRLAGNPVVSSDYPEYFKWATLRLLSEEIDPAGLWPEVEKLEEAITKRLALSEEEERVLARLRNFHLLKKALHLELTRPEFDRIQFQGERFRPEGALGNYFDRAVDFYRKARERDRSLAENALRLAPPAGAVVLITGGFHTSGIDEILNEKNIPHASISPRISRLGEEGLYRRVLLQENADVSQYFPDLELNKQEAILFKGLVEKVLPSLGQSYGMTSRRLRALASRAVRNHPVLNRRFQLLSAGQSAIEAPLLTGSQDQYGYLSSFSPVGVRSEVRSPKSSPAAGKDELLTWLLEHGFKRVKLRKGLEKRERALEVGIFSEFIPDLMRQLADDRELSKQVSEQPIQYLLFPYVQLGGPVISNSGAEETIRQRSLIIQSLIRGMHQGLEDSQVFNYTFAGPEILKILNEMREAKNPNALFIRTLNELSRSYPRGIRKPLGKFLTEAASSSLTGFYYTSSYTPSIQSFVSLLRSMQQARLGERERVLFTFLKRGQSYSTSDRSQTYQLHNQFLDLLGGKRVKDPRELSALKHWQLSEEGVTVDFFDFSDPKATNLDRLFKQKRTPGAVTVINLHVENGEIFDRMGLGTDFSVLAGDIGLKKAVAAAQSGVGPAVFFSPHPHALTAMARQVPAMIEANMRSAASSLLGPSRPHRELLELYYELQNPGNPMDPETIKRIEAGLVRLMEDAREREEFRKTFSFLVRPGNLFNHVINVLRQFEKGNSFEKIKSSLPHFGAGLEIDSAPLHLQKTRVLVDLRQIVTGYGDVAFISDWVNILLSLGAESGDVLIHLADTRLEELKMGVVRLNGVTPDIRRFRFLYLEKGPSGRVRPVILKVDEPDKLPTLKQLRSKGRSELRGPSAAKTVRPLPVDLWKEIKRKFSYRGGKIHAAKIPPAARSKRQEVSFLIWLGNNPAASEPFREFIEEIAQVISDPEKKIYFPGGNRALRVALGGRYTEKNSFKPLTPGFMNQARDLAQQVVDKEQIKDFSLKITGARFNELDGTVVLLVEHENKLKELRSIAFRALTSGMADSQKGQFRFPEDEEGGGSFRGDGVITLARLLPARDQPVFRISDTEKEMIRKVVAQIHHRLSRTPLRIPVQRLSLIAPNREFLEEVSEDRVRVVELQRREGLEEKRADLMEKYGEFLRQLEDDIQNHRPVDYRQALLGVPEEPALSKRQSDLEKKMAALLTLAKRESILLTLRRWLEEKIIQWGRTGRWKDSWDAFTARTLMGLIDEYYPHLQAGGKGTRSAVQLLADAKEQYLRESGHVRPFKIPEDPSERFEKVISAFNGGVRVTTLLRSPPGSGLEGSAIFAATLMKALLSLKSKPGINSLTVVSPLRIQLSSGGGSDSFDWTLREGMTLVGGSIYLEGEPGVVVKVERIREARLEFHSLDLSQNETLRNNFPLKKKGEPDPLRYLKFSLAWAAVLPEDQPTDLFSLAALASVLEGFPEVGVYGGVNAFLGISGKFGFMTNRPSLIQNGNGVASPARTAKFHYYPFTPQIHVVHRPDLQHVFPKKVLLLDPGFGKGQMRKSTAAREKAKAEKLGEGDSLFLNVMHKLQEDTVAMFPPLTAGAYPQLKANLNTVQVGTNLTIGVPATPEPLGQLIQDVKAAYSQQTGGQTVGALVQGAGPFGYVVFMADDLKLLSRIIDELLPSYIEQLKIYGLLRQNRSPRIVPFEMVHRPLTDFEPITPPRELKKSDLFTDEEAWRQRWISELRKEGFQLGHLRGGSGTGSSFFKTSFEKFQRWFERAGSPESVRLEISKDGDEVLLHFMTEGKEPSWHFLFLPVRKMTPSERGPAQSGPERSEVRRPLPLKQLLESSSISSSRLAAELGRRYPAGNPGPEERSFGTLRQVSELFGGYYPLSGRVSEQLLIPQLLTNPRGPEVGLVLRLEEAPRSDKDRQSLRHLIQQEKTLRLNLEIEGISPEQARRLEKIFNAVPGAQVHVLAARTEVLTGPSLKMVSGRRFPVAILTPHLRALSHSGRGLLKVHLGKRGFDQTAAEAWLAVLQLKQGVPDNYWRVYLPEELAQLQGVDFEAFVQNTLRLSKHLSTQA